MVGDKNIQMLESCPAQEGLKGLPVVVQRILNNALSDIKHSTDDSLLALVSHRDIKDDSDDLTDKIVNLKRYFEEATLFNLLTRYINQRMDESIRKILR